MSTPHRPMMNGLTIHVGLKIKHFRTGQVYEITNIKSFASSGGDWALESTVIYKNVVTGEEYSRLLQEFWDEVEVEPGKWVPRFEEVKMSEPKESISERAWMRAQEVPSVTPRHKHDLARMCELVKGLRDRLGEEGVFRAGEDGLELPQEVCDWTSELSSIAVRYLPVLEGEAVEDDY